MERFLWICFAGALGTGVRYLVGLWAALCMDSRLAGCGAASQFKLMTLLDSDRAADFVTFPRGGCRG